jgi:hypothetical protein
VKKDKIKFLYIFNCYPAFCNRGYRGVFLASKS